MSWGARSSRLGGPLPPDWQRIRRLVIARDGGRCVFCGAPGTDVDHIYSSTDHRPENLRLLCRHCHMRRTQGQAADSWRRKGRRRPRRRVFREPPRHPGYR